MAQILSQDEIDALLTGLDEVTHEEAPKASVAELDAEVKKYDFESTTLLGRIKFPGIDAINDQFNRSIRATLASHLRLVVDSTVAPTEVIPFKEFLKRVPVPSNLHVLRFDPLRGHVLLVVDSRIVFTIVEIFLGSISVGKARVEGREFTSIEQRLVRRIINAMLLDLEKAWKNIQPVKIHYVRSEINPQFAKVAQSDEAVVVSKFKLEIEEVQGALTVCIPLSTLQAIKSKLQSTFQWDEAVDPAWVKSMLRNLKDTSVDMVVPLGKAKITGTELKELGVGDVIVLDTNFDSLFPVLIQGQPRLEGRLGVYKGSRSIEVVKKLKLEED